jgi:hypothetical protein
MIVLARFEESRHMDEPPTAKDRWNAYVDATIAFLKRDLS